MSSPVASKAVSLLPDLLGSTKAPVRVSYHSDKPLDSIPFSDQVVEVFLNPLNDNKDKAHYPNNEDHKQLP